MEISKSVPEAAVCVKADGAKGVRWVWFGVSDMLGVRDVAAQVPRQQLGTGQWALLVNGTSIMHRHTPLFMDALVLWLASQDRLA